MAKAISFLSLAALVAGITSPPSITPTINRFTTATSSFEATASPPITSSPTFSYTVNKPIFSSLPSGQPSVRGLFLGSASVINVTDGKTTYSYICPKSSSSSVATYFDQENWKACDDEYARIATFIDSPSEYAYYITTDWNSQSYTFADTRGNGTAILTHVQTDSISHTASLTQFFACSLSGDVIKTNCNASFTAPGLNSAESSEIGSMNYEQTAVFDDTFKTTKTSSSWDQSEWLTLGPVPVSSGMEKLSGEAKETGKETGRDAKKNGAGKMVVGWSLGLVPAISAVMLFV